jgi:capsular polysaccharide biosynthesis protein
VDLDYYWIILRRGWRLLALVVGVTAVLSFFATLNTGGSWKFETEVLVNPLLDPAKLPQNPQYDYNYYAELTSEYILDDFLEVLKTKAFADQVSAALGGSVDSDVILHAIKPERVHRTMKVTITAATQREGMAIGKAIDDLIVAKAPSFFKDANPVRDSANYISVAISEVPTVVQRPTPVRVTAFWLLRTLVGVVAGIALVFVIHYFDPKLYDQWDVQRELDLQVLALVPAAGGGKSRAH